MGVDMYWVDKQRREEGYSAEYNDWEQSMVERITELYQCQKKLKRIKEIYENDEPFKALKIKEIVYGDLND